MPTLEEIADKEILISVVESQDYSNKMKGNIVKFGPSGYSPNICKYDVTHVAMFSGVQCPGMEICLCPTQTGALSVCLMQAMTMLVQ